MQDVSGFGLQVNVTASNTFPNGIGVTQFADDADPFDTPGLTIGDAASGLNGDLVTWSKAAPIEITLNVIAGSQDDTNLAVLMEANRPGKGKTPAQDVIGMQAVYPSGKLLTLTGGKMTVGPVGSSVASAGRFKSKAYQFKFENRTGTPG